MLSCVGLLGDVTALLQSDAKRVQLEAGRLVAGLVSVAAFQSGVWAGWSQQQPRTATEGPLLSALLSQQDQVGPMLALLAELTRSKHVVLHHEAVHALAALVCALPPTSGSGSGSVGLDLPEPARAALGSLFGGVSSSVVDVAAAADGGNGDPSSPSLDVIFCAGLSCPIGKVEVALKQEQVREQADDEQQQQQKQEVKAEEEDAAEGEREEALLSSLCRALGHAEVDDATREAGQLACWVLLQASAAAGASDSAGTVAWRQSCEDSQTLAQAQAYIAAWK